jgi:hypothetical protein
MEAIDTMFGIFKKDKGQQNQQVQTQAQPIYTPPVLDTGGINLTKQEAVQTLNLRKETLGICLEKNNIQNLVARVGLVLDETGSMKGQYKNGTTQEVVERLLPMGLKFDDNGELDMWIFAKRFKRLASVTEADFYQYVDREIMNNPANQLWEATYYAPVMRDVLKKYAQEEPSNIPTIIYFITDGENFDPEETEAIIKEASKYNIFWQFVGIGDEKFKFLKKLDDMGGRHIDNADFFPLNDIRQISDGELYNRLLQEYPAWERQARQLGMIH